MSDVGIMILGAMYAGVLVILIVSQLYCEEMPCTSPCAARVKFLVLGLSWDCWGSIELQLQLEVAKNLLSLTVTISLYRVR